MLANRFFFFWLFSWVLLFPFQSQASRREVRPDTLTRVSEASRQTPAVESIPKTARNDKRTDPVALISLGSLLVGLIGVLVGVPSLFLAGMLVALIAGVVSLVRIRRSGRQLGGKGYAIAGLVAGLISLAFVALIIAAFSAGV